MWLALLEHPKFWQRESPSAHGAKWPLACLEWPKMWPGHDFGLPGQLLILFFRMITWPAEMRISLELRFSAISHF